jgi:hypothetical protein
MGMDDVGTPFPDMTPQREKGLRQLEGLAMMGDRRRLDIVPGEQIIEISIAAGNADSMSEFTLGAGEIDRCVNMAIQTPGMIEQMQNSHGKYLKDLRLSL